MCAQLFSSILLTLPRQTTGGKGKSPSQTILELAADIQNKIPADFDIEGVLIYNCNRHKLSNKK